MPVEKGPPSFLDVCKKGPAPECLAALDAATPEQLNETDRLQ